MKNKTDKLHQFRWKGWFARLSGVLMLCFNFMATSLTTIGVGVMAVATITLVVSCDKDTQNQQQEQPQQPKHNVELKYGKMPSTQWQNISLDTLNKYNADPTVDTIFLIPEMYNQYSTFSTTQLQTLITKFRPRHDVNPNKVFGKGELQLKASSVVDNPEIVKFFQDTLGYYVTYNTQAKSK